MEGVGLLRSVLMCAGREYTPSTHTIPTDWFRLEQGSSKVYLLFRGWRNVIYEIKVKGATKRDQEFSLLS